MSEKHTPGPWNADIKDDTFMVISSEFRNHIITVWRGLQGNKVPQEEMKANANLIAAAPDLLAACEMFMQFDWLTFLDSAGGVPYSDDVDWSDFCDTIESAIAKAKGATK